jgi:hypothetical protein
MSALADQFTRFLDEQRWLLNVTPKTLEWYEEMFKLLRRLHPTLTEPADLTKGHPPESPWGEGGAAASLRSYHWQSHCRGLYHTPTAA